MNSQLFVRRLDTIRLVMWGKRLNLLRRLSWAERGLLTCSSLRTGIAKFKNAKLVRLLLPIVTKMEQWITCARKLRILAQHARKIRWREPQGKDLFDMLLEGRHVVSGYNGIGDAGLRGSALRIYRGLKNGSMPVLAKMLWSY